MTGRAVGALMVADFRERARRPAYLVTLLAAVALGYVAVPAPSSGWQIFQLGDYRGEYDSAYVGTVTALAGAVWLSLAGFYVVKNAIARDELTGVGQILATTPLRRVPYLVSKFLSNVLVLGSMTGVLAVTAAGMQLWRGESRALDPVALLLPFLLLALPLLAVTAAAAVLFETLPVLRGGAGNLAWFFAWMAGMVAVQSGGGPDLLGLGLITDSMRADIAASVGDTREFEFGVGLVEREAPLHPFAWSGLPFPGWFLVERLVIVAAAGALALVGAGWFHRFDPSGRWPRRRAVRVAPEGSAVAAEPAPVAPDRTVARPGTAVESGRSWFRLVRAEWQVLVGGVSRWWWVVAAGLSLLAVVLSPEGVVTAALPLAWVWPVLVWSRLGTHAAAHDVEPLLATCPGRQTRLLAQWAAGGLLALAVSAVPAFRLLAVGDLAGVGVWAAGVLFIPALALGLGTVGRTPRLFQVLYLLLWYSAFNGAAEVDFMGAVRVAGEPAGPSPVLVAGAGIALVCTAAAAGELRHAWR